MTDTIATTVDLRQIAPRERHALVFERFDTLQPGQALQLLNDHDPQPLRMQFENRSFGQFDWTALEAGPTLWRVRIGRLAASARRPGNDSCCSGGACGG